MSRKRYTRYRSSGVEWLGEIPEHWDLKRARFKVSLNPRKQEVNIFPKDMEVSFLPMEAVGDDGGLNLEQSRPVAEIETGYTYFSEGDITYAKITPCFENGKGAIMRGLQNGFGFGSTELTVIRPGTDISREYLYYLTISNEFRKNGEAWMYGAGGQKRVPDNFVREFRFAWPPFSEQHTIAVFLDRETVRIDKLIAKKQRQIELLQEKRSTLISHAVTKGLDPNEKMKDSGAEWLGKIPEHWEAVRFKFVVSEPLQYGANESAEYDEPSWPRYVRITDINENGNLREETFKSLPEDVAQPYLLRDGDLLLARSGATVGKTFLYMKSWGRAAYAGYLIRSRFQQKCMLPAFSAYFCRSSNYWDWLKSSLIQATIQNVSAERYANMVVPMPPIDEQQAIATFLDAETARIDTLIEKVEKSIELLREYRTALISTAVTGNIDVCEEVPAS